MSFFSFVCGLLLLLFWLLVGVGIVPGLCVFRLSQHRESEENAGVWREGNCGGREEGGSNRKPKKAKTRSVCQVVVERLETN